MIITSEEDMLALGQKFAKSLTLPAVFELIGDVGTGKTTFARGLAAGLGVNEPVTSPSFTISKRYAFSNHLGNGELVHYDFYRLNDIGIMREELAETLSLPHSVTVIEWGDDIANLLPDHKYRFVIQLQEDGSRLVKLNDYALQHLGED